MAHFLPISLAKPPVILGLSLNSRTIGMAVVSGGTLIDYKIKLLKERWSNQKLERIISCINLYIQEYAVEKVSLLLPHRHYTNPETKILLEKIKGHCRKAKLPICYYKAKDLHTLHEHTRAKKKALMQALSTLYPELSLAQKKELANKKRYYCKLFEAVGAATLHAREIY